MGKTVSRNQVMELVARIVTEVNWDALFGDDLQEDVIDLRSEEFGRKFTIFLKKGCQFVFDEPKLFLTEPFDPAKFCGRIGEIFTVWKGPVDGDGLLGEEDVDSRSLALTEVALSSLIFIENCFNTDEEKIKGEEKLRRLKARPDVVRLGGNVFLGLLLDLEAKKENSILEFLYQTKKIEFLDFPGLVIRHSYDIRYSKLDPKYRGRNLLCLRRCGDADWRFFLQCLSDYQFCDSGCLSVVSVI